MTNRLPAADLPNMLAALRAERTQMLTFTNSLTDDEWTAPSAAARWRIADVVAHIGATARNFYTPAGLRTSLAASLEQHNEDPVDRRRNWNRAQVMAEYQRASRRATTLLDVVRRTPATRMQLPLADLGRYPLGLMIGGALVFDHHTHLRHDMAPALGRPAPPTDADRMRAVLTWMIAVLSNQVAQAPVAGLDARVALTLTGPGGGTWWIDRRRPDPLQRRRRRPHHRPRADLPRLGHAAITLARQRRHGHRRHRTRHPLPRHRQHHLIAAAKRASPGRVHVNLDKGTQLFLYLRWPRRCESCHHERIEALQHGEPLAHRGL